jgi:ketosteroid isomerase-like protein
MRRTRLRAVLLVVVSLAATGFFAAQAHVSDRPKSVLEQYAAAYKNANPWALAALYADDAILVPEESGRIHGRQDIERFWKHRFSRPRSGGSPSTAVLDEGWGEDYSYLMASMEGVQEEAYNFTLCLKRDARGQWQIASEMWNLGGFPARLVPAR